jgi:hypothetical protein
MFPQNKIPYFKDDRMYAKYMILTFLFTNDLIVLIAKQSLLSLITNFLTWKSQFKLWSSQTPKIVVSDMEVICLSFNIM